MKSKILSVVVLMICCFIGYRWYEEVSEERIEKALEAARGHFEGLAEQSEEVLDIDKLTKLEYVREGLAVAVRARDYAVGELRSVTQQYKQVVVQRQSSLKLQYSEYKKEITQLEHDIKELEKSGNKRTHRSYTGRDDLSEAKHTLAYNKKMLQEIGNGDSSWGNYGEVAQLKQSMESWRKIVDERQQRVVRLAALKSTASDRGMYCYRVLAKYTTQELNRDYQDRGDPYTSLWVVYMLPNYKILMQEQLKDEE